MRTFSIGGVVGPILFVVVIAVAGALRPDYSHISNFISELGATGTSRAWLINYAGFVPAGLMLLGFGLALGHQLRRHHLSPIAAVLVIAFAVGMTTSGIASCDLGCPQGTGTLENRVHDNIAPVAFLSLIIGVAIFGFQVRRIPRWRGLSAYSLLSSAVAFGLMATLVASIEAREFTGLWQRLLLGVLFLWCAVVSTRTHQDWFTPV